MKIKDLCQMTNENGKSFLRYTKAKVLGIENDLDDSCRFFAIVRYSDNTVSAWSMPKKNTSCAACSFGNLKYFAMVWAYHNMPEKKILWNVNGYPIRPIWRNDFTKEETEQWDKYEKEMLEKYS